jgi:molecular chaperone GrpE
MSENGKEPANENEPGTEEVNVAEAVEGLEALVEEAAAKAADQQTPEAEAAEVEPDPLEVLSAENAELQDRVLRLAADMENLRRRTEREKAEATLYAASNFARDMLAVSDNMDRALSAVSEEQRAVADDVTKNLMQGVEMVQRELLNTFERHGIRRITPMGERFDPNLHQAMFEVPDEKTEAGTVVQVVQPGFVIGERVLRPAMVGVAKGGPKPAANTAAEPAGDGENGVH